MNPTIICSSAHWDYKDGGVHTYMRLLVKGLNKAGWNARVLVTEPLARSSIPPEKDPDIPVDYLPIQRFDSWEQQWGKMRRYLENHAPCIYLSNKDFRHSCVASVLPNNIRTIGVLHSNDPIFYNHAKRMYPYWDKILCVSNTIAQVTHEGIPTLKERTHVIEHGIDIQNCHRTTLQEDDPLRLLYVGRLAQKQKRIFDLVEIVKKLDTAAIPFCLTIVGFGPDENALKKAMKPYVQKGLVRFTGAIANTDVQPLSAAHDVFLLTSEYEGLPISLLETMSQGCVPIVSAIKSGIPDIVEHTDNGMMFPIGNTDCAVEMIKELHNDRPLLTQMGHRAAETIRKKFSVDRMVQNHIDVFTQCMQEPTKRVRKDQIDAPSHLQHWWMRNVPKPCLWPFTILRTFQHGTNQRP